MSEFGGSEILGPGEGGGGAPEQLSEDAKQRFAAAAKAMQQIQREEKRAKKRDDQVAKAIVQFLGQDEHSHLFLLVSRLVARDCPSIFILAILSLISEQCRIAVDEYAREHNIEVDLSGEKDLALTSSALTEEMNHALLFWISRLQVTLSMDAKRILEKLLLDNENIDGTVLQLTTFVLQEFFAEHERSIDFEKLQALTAGILQTVFEPFLHHLEELAEEHGAKNTEEEQ